MATYKTINELKEIVAGALLDSDTLVVSNPGESFRIKVSELNKSVSAFTQKAPRELTNATLNDISNNVGADEVHLQVVPDIDISRGTMVMLLPNYNTQDIKVTIASSDSMVLGIAKTDIKSGTTGLIVVSGKVNMDLSVFTTGSRLFYQGGALTTTPRINQHSQVIGYVLVSATDGQLLVNSFTSSKISSEISYSNINNSLYAVNVQEAIDELLRKITQLEKTIFTQATAPTIAEGASEGDTWYDTTTESYNVYRENPSGSGIFAWEPLLYHNNDILDGGSW